MSASLKDYYFPMSVILPARYLYGVGKEDKPFKEFLQLIGATEKEYEQSNFKINGEQLLVAYRWAKKNFKSEVSLQARLEYYSATTVGVAGLAAMSSSTIKDALDITVKAMPLYMPAISAKFLETEKKSRLEFEMLADFQELNTLLMEMTVGVINLISLEIIEKPLFREVHFKHPKSNDPEISLNQEGYDALFGCPVKFSSHFNGILGNVDDVQLPARMANKSTYDIADKLLDKDLEAARLRDTMTSRVRCVLEKAAQNGHFLSLEELADELSMTTRTVSRKLSREESNYKSLFNEVRFWRARELLSYSDSSLKKIALKSGFSNGDAFTRAFKAEYKETPSQWRENNRLQ